jgi:hypothetical protein
MVPKLYRTLDGTGRSLVETIPGITGLIVLTAALVPGLRQPHLCLAPELCGFVEPDKYALDSLSQIRNAKSTAVPPSSWSRLIPITRVTVSYDSSAKKLCARTNNAKTLLTGGTTSSSPSINHPDFQQLPVLPTASATAKAVQM